MSRALLILNDAGKRAQAVQWINSLLQGTRVEFKKPRRTLPQNSRQWAMLTDIATQLTWHGRKLKTNDWKLVFLAALKIEMDLVPNIDGTGFVDISGKSTSDLSVEEEADFLTLMGAFGDEHGVMWSDPKEIAQRRQLEEGRK